MQKMDISSVCQMMRERSETFPLMEVARRRELLVQLKKLISKYEKKLEGALYSDLKKCSYEAYSTEIDFVHGEIDYFLKHLDKLVKPQKVKTPLMFKPGKSYILSQPYGLVLVIAPWNFPVQLLLAPLVGAIAAGNCAVIKPSEFTPTVSIVIKSMFRELDSPYIKVVEGGVPETTELLDSHFDYIFFTGSTRVGKIVMEKAAKNLTPVTLELGGKSPCVVWGKIDLDVAARRIVWGRFVNSGQICVAPDYVLVQKDLKDKLVEQLKKTIKQFYGKKPLSSKDYGKIINDNQFERLMGYLKQGEVLHGGDANRESCQIAPTLIVPNEDSDLLKDEIFGPILPIIEVSSQEEIEKIISKNARPLAFYIFSGDEQFATALGESVPAGGVCINDTVMHIATPYLPFGGVGASGMGSYHGKFSFETFSHKKSILKRSFRFDFAVRYPPYWGKEGLVRKLLNWFGS